MYKNRKQILNLYSLLLILTVVAFSYTELSKMCGAAEPSPFWSQDGFDAAASGQSPFPGPQTGRLKWQIILDGWASSPVIDADGTVYVGSKNGTLLAIGKDGSVKWKRQWPIEGVEHPPGISSEEKAELRALGIRYSGHIFSCAVGQDGTIYVARNISHDASDEIRYLIALTMDGQEKWRYPIGSHNFITKLTLGQDGIIYFGTSGRKSEYHAVHPRGSQKWKKALGQPGEVLCSAAVGRNGLIYVAGDRLWALDPANGNVVYEYQKPIYAAAGIYGPAVGPDGTIYVPSGIRSQAGHRFYAFRPDLTLKWNINAGVMELTPAVASDGTIYIHTWGDVLKKTDGKSEIPPGFHAINPDGSVKWSLAHLMKAPPEALDDNPKGADMGSDSSPTIGSDGIIYFGSDIGRIFAIKPDGKLLWKVSLGGEFDTRPAIDAKGTLYICHAGGPGSKLDGRPRCYAVSDNGISVKELEKKHRDRFKGLSRLERLRLELEEARKAGNMIEIQEIEALISELTGETQGYDD